MRNEELLRSDFLAAAAAVLAGGFVGCSGPTSISTPSGAPTGSPSAVPTSSPSPVPTGLTTPAQIAVAATTAGALPSAFAGLSYEKANISSGLFASSDTSLAGCFRRLGTSLLRIGGNSVDETTWVGGGAGGTSGEVAPPDVDKLASFLLAAGWQVLYGINLGSNTPQNAAAEAAYVAGKLGASLYGFEIGNECDLYSSNGIRSSTYTFSDFVEEWQIYASQIVAAAPGSKLTGPASAGNVENWTVPFASAEAARIVLVTQHYYRGNGQSASSTIAELLIGDPALPGELQALRGAATSAKIAAGYRMSETNSFYHGGAPGISDAYRTALWALDYMMIGAQNGCAGFNFHGGGDGTGYTPIADSNGAVVEVRPEYYGLLFVSMIPTGPLLTVNLQTSLLFSAYAVAGSDGATYVVLINKDATATAAASISLPARVSQGTALALAGVGLNATTGTTLGGAAVAPNGTWTPTPATPFTIGASHFALDVPPAAALLVRCM
jgi:hypothetical protein